MVWLKTSKLASINKVKNIDKGWLRSCQTCHRKFVVGQYRYDWRLHMGNYASSFWRTDCQKCLMTELKLIEIGSISIRKAL